MQTYCVFKHIPVKSHSFAVSLTLLAMKSQSHADYVFFLHFNLNKNYESQYYGFMNKSVKPIVCVLVVSDLMLATGILTKTNRYPLSILTVRRRLIVLVAWFQNKSVKTQRIIVVWPYKSKSLLIWSETPCYLVNVRH